MTKLYFSPSKMFAITVLLLSLYITSVDITRKVPSNSKVKVEDRDGFFSLDQEEIEDQKTATEYLDKRKKEEKSLIGLSKKGLISTKTVNKILDNMDYEEAIRYAMQKDGLA